jgi:hypothetical protein
MKKIVFFIFAFYFFFTLLPKSTLADEQTIYIPDKDVIQGLFFKQAKNITIDGTINGEAYLVGENITVNGTINGDLIAIGSNIDINGTVSDNLRTFSKQIHVYGDIRKNATIVSMNANIENKSILSGNVVMLANKAQIFGNLEGESHIQARSLYVDGEFQKQSILSSPNLTISKNTIFSQGKIISSGDKSGNIFLSKNTRLISFILAKIQYFGNLLSFFGYLICGLILTFLFPKNFTNINHFLFEKPLACFIVGLLFYLLLPFILVFIALTVVGIPISILIALSSLMVMFVSRIVVSLSIGSRILKDQNSKFFPLILGLIILQVVFWIPFFGTAIKIIAVLLGSGAIILSKLGKINR